MKTLLKKIAIGVFVMVKENKYILFISIFLCFLFSGCFGQKGHTMTREEICDYMNENFKGKFELIDHEIENTDDADITTVYLKCSLFPEETVVTMQGYSWCAEPGWVEIKRTNYYYFVYKNKIEQKVAGYIKDWFGDFDYKIVNTTDEENVMCNMKKFKNLQNYLSSPICIRFNIVIDTHDEETKKLAAAKAESIEKNYKIENSLCFIVFFYEDDNFDKLTEEEIRNMDYHDYDNSYIF